MEGCGQWLKQMRYVGDMAGVVAWDHDIGLTCSQSNSRLLVDLVLVGAWVWQL